MLDFKKYLVHFINVFGLAILIGIIFMPFCFYISRIDDVTPVQTAFIPLMGIYQQYEYNLRFLYIALIIIYLVAALLYKKKFISYILQLLVILGAIAIISFVFFDKSFVQIEALPSMLTFYIVTMCLLGLLLIGNTGYFIYKIKE